MHNCKEKWKIMKKHKYKENEKYFQASKMKLLSGCSEEHRRQAAVRLLLSGCSQVVAIRLQVLLSGCNQVVGMRLQLGT